MISGFELISNAITGLLHMPASAITYPKPSQNEGNKNMSPLSYKFFGFFIKPNKSILSLSFNFLIFFSRFFCNLPLPPISM